MRLHRSLLVLLDRVLGLLDQAENAHAEDARRHPVGVEVLELVELLADRRKLDRLAVTALTESAAPPRASPSSFVSTTPSNATRSWNASATATASWPVMESRTSSTLCGFAALPDVCELLHERLVDLETAGGVDDHDIAALGLRLLDAVGGRADRVRPGEHGNLDLAAKLLELRHGGGPLQVGRDERGADPLLAEQQASFAAAVVLPEPWRPASRITVGLLLDMATWSCQRPSAT